MPDSTDSPIPRPHTVLLIDDEPDICHIWSMLLEMEGLATIAASNGADGLTKANTHRPDLIITDFMMPMMDGLAVCRAIRRSEHFKGIGIILWSAARNIDAGDLADLVVEKPVELDAFLAHIRRLLTRPRP